MQSEPVTISPPGLGVTLKIPRGAVRPDADKPVNVAVQACLSGSTFIYPEGCTLLSAVYHISADSHFEKEVDMTFDHFAELETEKQASAMTIFQAESLPTVKDGKAQFIFSPIDGGKFAVGETQCTFSTQEFSLVSAGSKESAEIRKIRCPEIYTQIALYIHFYLLGKRYIALCSFTEGVQDVGHAAVAHAAVAVSLHNDVYITVHSPHSQCTSLHN